MYSNKNTLIAQIENDEAHILLDVNITFKKSLYYIEPPSVSNHIYKSQEYD